ncbi:hypothetical protein [Homoserinibacter sp. GY 40078]|uniref:hypothetical protein n=1 Tax=Homoserinibacter sp. GY 40078 TaxID=2603275 RepID=UPI0011C89C67|nr:hypothetical protein [Homoserinibacter sp. GY 40078]TXK18540.1 hypothetical protein FVQ89_00860 [Homoserinibacter sp. GY 40078]
MSRHRSSAPRTIFRIPRAVPSLVLLVGGGVLLASSAGLTSAAFVETIRVQGTQSGHIDVAQGPAASDDYSDPSAPKVFTNVPERRTLRALVNEPTVEPSLDGAAILYLDLQARPGSATADAWLTLENPGVPSVVWDSLRVSVYADARQVMAGGIPISPVEIADLNGGRGAHLGRLPEDGKPIYLTILLWFAHDAPPEAYRQGAFNIRAAVSGETITGERFTVEGDFS